MKKKNLYAYVSKKGKSLMMERYTKIHTTIATTQQTQTKFPFELRQMCALRAVFIVQKASIHSSSSTNGYMVASRQIVNEWGAFTRCLYNMYISIGLTHRRRRQNTNTLSRTYMYSQWAIGCCFQRFAFIPHNIRIYTTENQIFTQNQIKKKKSTKRQQQQQQPTSHPPSIEDNEKARKNVSP